MLLLTSDVISSVYVSTHFIIKPAYKGQRTRRVKPCAEKMQKHQEGSENSKRYGKAKVNEQEGMDRGAWGAEEQ